MRHHLQKPQSFIGLIGSQNHKLQLHPGLGQIWEGNFLKGSPLESKFQQPLPQPVQEKKLRRKHMSHFPTKSKSADKMRIGVL